MGELPSVVLTLALLNEKAVALAPAKATRLGRMLKRRPRRKAAPARSLSEEVRLALTPTLTLTPILTPTLTLTLPLPLPLTPTLPRCCASID